MRAGSTGEGEGSWRRSISQCFPDRLGERSKGMEWNFSLWKCIYVELRFVGQELQQLGANSPSSILSVGSVFAYLELSQCVSQNQNEVHIALKLNKQTTKETPLICRQRVTVCASDCIKSQLKASHYACLQIKYLKIYRNGAFSPWRRWFISCNSCKWFGS